jgi:hypothetical protein
MKTRSYMRRYIELSLENTFGYNGRGAYKESYEQEIWLLNTAIHDLQSTDYGYILAKIRKLEKVAGRGFFGV